MFAPKPTFKTVLTLVLQAFPPYIAACRQGENAATQDYGQGWRNSSACFCVWPVPFCGDLTRNIAAPFDGRPTETQRPAETTAWPDKALCKGN